MGRPFCTRGHERAATRSLAEPDARSSLLAHKDLRVTRPAIYCMERLQKVRGLHPSLGSEGPGLKVGGARHPAEGQVGVNGATWWLPAAPHPGAPEA